jgi:hypothetical protein
VIVCLTIPTLKHSRKGEKYKNERRNYIQDKLKKKTQKKPKK